MFKRGFLLAALVLVLGLVVMPAAAQEGRQVYAFYFGWYTGDSWGDPRLTDHPAQPYDSRDAGALGRHIDEARGAGIDAFIMSWYGPKNDNLTHQVFNALLDQAGARGFRAGAVVDMHEAGYNATVEEVTQSLSYLINDRANHPAYLRYDGKPVIYFWNQGRFNLAQWQQIRQQVDPNRGTIWVMEGTSTGLMPAFDGLYLFNTAWSGNPAATAQQWANRTRAAGGWFYTPTVLPGWDESALAAGRPNPTTVRPRNNGQFLTNSWNGAVSSGASIILIVSWNEYLENSHIEPSQQFGTQALDTLRPLIEAWKSGAPAPAPGGAPGGEAGSPTGVTYTVNSNLRLRSAPNTGADIITTVPFNSTVDVIGRLGDSSWVQVNFGGGSGWMSSSFGQFSGDLNTVPVTG